MKSKQQAGSAHVIITVVLVVALMGALGFIFWQNFIQKKAVTTTATPASSQTTATAAQPAQPAPKSTQTALVIGNYAVEVPYDGTEDAYTVTPATTGGFAGGYTVYSKNLTAQCGSSVNVGSIKRFNQGDSVPGPSNTITVGNYVYALSVGGYGDCSALGVNAGTDAISAASSAFADAFKNLKAVN